MASPILEIHLEEWNHALHIGGRGHKSDVKWLLELLKKYKVHPKIYVLEDWANESNGYYNSLAWQYQLKSHGVHHYYDEKADRSPYFNQEGIPMPPSGGFYWSFLCEKLCVELLKLLIPLLVEMNNLGIKAFLEEITGFR